MLKTLPSVPESDFYENKCSDNSCNCLQQKVQEQILNGLPAFTNIHTDPRFVALRKEREGLAEFKPNENGIVEFKLDDPVNHPSHYKAHGMECIDVIEAFELSFNLGNAIKYILRHGKKGNAKQDLEKARWYLDRELSTYSEN